MSPDLERRYRRALRWYPRSWRARHAESMIATLLDVAAARAGTRPSRSELFSLAANGLAVRAALAERVVPATVRDRAAVLGLGIGTAIALAGALFDADSAPLLRGGGGPVGAGGGITFGPFPSLSIILYGLWIIAFIAVVCGHEKTTRALLLLTLPAAIVARTGGDHWGMELYPTSTTVVFLELFALITLAGRPTTTRRFRAGTGFFAMAAALALAAELAWISRYPNALRFFLFDRSFFSWTPWAGFVGATLIAATMLCLLLRNRAWAGGLAIVSLPFFALSLFDHDTAYQRSGDIAIVLVATFLVAAVVTVRAMGLRIRITRT
jgi:hypothetical protein